VTNRKARSRLCSRYNLCVRKHGYSKRRTWRKVHLAMDANTGQICAALMTHQDVGDGEVLPELLDQIPADTPIGVVGGDGAYDIRAGVLNRMTSLARPQSVRIA